MAVSTVIQIRTHHGNARCFSLVPALDPADFLYAGPVSPKPDGSLYLPVPLPQIPQFLGLQVNVQVASLVPPASDAGSSAIEVTNGLAWTLGK